MKLKQFAIASALILVSGMAFADHDHEGCRHGHGEKGKFDKTQFQEHRAQHFAKHQEKLHTMLQLNATQENAWKIFQGQIKPDEKMQRPDFASLDALTTPQRLDKMEAWEKERDARQAQRATATRNFYAQLNDAQKKVFDENAFPHRLHHKHHD